MLVARCEKCGAEEPAHTPEFKATWRMFWSVDIGAVDYECPQCRPGGPLPHRVESKRTRKKTLTKPEGGLL
jgi:uncharacterized Zn finger protein